MNIRTGIVAGIVIAFVVLALVSCAAPFAQDPRAVANPDSPTFPVLLPSPTAIATGTSLPSTSGTGTGTGIDPIALSLTSSAADRDAQIAQAIADESRARAQAAANELIVATIAADSTRNAYAQGQQATADAIRNEQGILSLAGTREAFTRTLAAGTATRVALDLAIADEIDRAQIAGTARAENAVREQRTAEDKAASDRVVYGGTRILGLTVAILAIVLGTYAIYAFLRNRAARGAIVNTYSGVIVTRWINGELDTELIAPAGFLQPGNYGPDGEYDDPESEIANVDSLPYLSNGKPAELSREAIKRSHVRSAALELVRGSINIYGQQGTRIADGEEIGWPSAGKWTEITDWLIPYIVKPRGRSKRTRIAADSPFPTLGALYNAIGTGQAKLGTRIAQDAQETRAIADTLSRSPI